MEKELIVTSDAMNSLAMEVIMLAGDARLFVFEAVQAAAEGDFPKVDKKLDAANKKIAAAHGIQTEIVQSEGEGEKLEHTLLFIHAQDTLMTVYSEMNMIKQLKSVLKHYDNRITALERRLENE